MYRNFLLLFILSLAHFKFIQGDPNVIDYVDLLGDQNQRAHRTSPYRIPQLILRRGQAFNLRVQLRRNYDPVNDKIRMELTFTKPPTIFFPIVSPDTILTEDELKLWSAQVTASNGRIIECRVNVPVDTAVGLWQLSFSTKATNSSIITKHPRAYLAYILFNPWISSDDVFLDREDARNEYVLTDVGKIYVGTYSNQLGRRWRYGQFDAIVLTTLTRMLDRTLLNSTDRADAVQVARTLSSLVNANDDDGLVVGKWDNMSLSETWRWDDSSAIFRQFVAGGGRPVKFGQCWVFGGVLTTSLRALGIPARTISNFMSAHDSDSSLTVDKFYSELGSQLEGVTADSIWNFHVWSEAWMQRYDLPDGYGGWQAIDSTPQEPSQNRYQLGPASVKAVKQGNVDYAYDVGFVFSEVNAEIVSWHLDGRRLRWYRASKQKGNVGRIMLTKRIGLYDAYSRTKTLDSENIVLSYRYPDKSPEAAQVYAYATNLAGLTPLFNSY